METDLNQLIDLFYSNKQQLEKYKKATEICNKEIKQGLEELGTNEFETESGLKAKITIQKRESLDEENLIARLLELKADAAVELVPTINWVKLEDMIYNGKLDAAELIPYKNVKEIKTLKVVEVKGDK